MKITLKVNGQKMTFSKEELTSIVEEHLRNKKSQMDQKITISCTLSVPKIGKWFKVNPLTINRQLFVAVRENSSEEKNRKLILEAFEELDYYPKRYAKTFWTMIPEKHTYQGKYVFQIKDSVKNKGGHIANWVEQALEWAQRISNGETWRNLHKADKGLPHRLVIWKDGEVRLVGGSSDLIYLTTSYSVKGYKDMDEIPWNVVPLIVDC